MGHILLNRKILALLRQTKEPKEKTAIISLKRFGLEFLENSLNRFKRQPTAYELLCHEVLLSIKIKFIWTGTKWAESLANPCLSLSISPHSQKPNTEQQNK